MMMLTKETQDNVNKRNKMMMLTQKHRTLLTKDTQHNVNRRNKMMMLTQKQKMLLAKETQDNINEETGGGCEGKNTR